MGMAVYDHIVGKLTDGRPLTEIDGERYAHMLLGLS
jgi:hypothetical protein